MDHLDAIMEIKNAVDPAVIKNIVPFIDKKAKNNLMIEKRVDKDIRNVLGYRLDFKTPTNIFYWNYLKREIQRLYYLYKSKFPKMRTSKIAQIDLLKYNVGGKYEVHTDHFTTLPRALSVIINLNDDYEGGNLIFTDQQDKEIKKYKLGKGSIVFFPSNFLYPHSITPITKGKRYSIVAWLQ
jgi:hypothetical protein